MDEQTKKEIARLLKEQVLLEDLKKAAEDAEKAKKVVLQILRSRGIIAFDGRDALDETWREFIRGKG